MTTTGEHQPQEGFPFKAGDKVRRTGWKDEVRYVTITAIGETLFLGRDTVGDQEYNWSIRSHGSDGPWEEYTPPPQRTTWEFQTEHRPVKYGEMYVTDGGGMNLYQPPIGGPVRSISPVHVIVAPATIKETT